MFKAEKMGETRTRYSTEKKTDLGGGLIVDVTKVTPDNSYKGSLPNMWLKSGYIDRLLPDYWWIDTYAYDDKGGCWGLFNPQIKGKRINFDYMLEATEENLELLLKAVATLAYGEKAKTA